MTTQPQPQCSERVPDRTGYYPYQCSRRGVVERDGRWYCRQHDPVAVKKRRAAKSAAWETRAMASLDRIRLAKAAPDLLAALEGIMDYYQLIEDPDVWEAARAAIAKARGGG